MIGMVGELLLLIALVAGGVSGAAFFQSARSGRGAPRWMPIARGGWYVMGAAVLAASGLLKRWRPSVMTVVAVHQTVLLTMVVGVQLGGGFELGASPFDTLAEAMPEAPIVQQNPGFVPADGTGLNDLLQNPWMAIHPPIMFTGFAAMLVPFAFALAALWKRRYTEWVKPALPWTLFAAMMLGTGIAMGGYWAYVTLNFGGYWAWDPVENASLVPWLVGIAALHTMLVQKKSGRAHKASLLLTILAYTLVVYSTYLTRSNVLSNASVHAFVSLGMDTQLLAWVVGTLGVGVGMLVWRWGDLPTPSSEARFLSREFMMFSGALLLAAIAAVVTVGTSSPILGQLFRNSPSGVPVEFYNRWTLPLALGVVFLAGLGQLFWWNKMTIEHLNRVLLKPIAGAVAATVAVLIFTPFARQTVARAPAGGGGSGGEAAAQQTAGIVGIEGAFEALSTFWATYGQGLLLILLVFAAFFALFGNGLVMWRIGRGNPRMAGGALGHVGFALLMLGVVASSAFSDPIAPRGLTEEGKERTAFVAAKGRAQQVDGYTVTYEGKTKNERGRGVYELRFETPGGDTFTLRPVAYQGSGKQWFMHPDLKHYFSKDIYASVTPREATGQQSSEKNGGEITLGKGQRRTLGTDRFDVTFEGFAADVPPARTPDSAKIAVAARLKVANRRTGETRRLQPIYLVMQDRSERFGQVTIDDWGLTITFTGMNVDLVVQAKEKPFIGVLWAGILVLSMGLGLAMYRRTKALAFSEDRRGTEA
ncbi:MAG: cytochrome C assembly protein [Bacteroidetes bacterium QS_7_67_15]|nr:MAG: cytochrome C assembly protein [Bacteroidetes bacterium QS_7_67_15]